MPGAFTISSHAICFKNIAARIAHTHVKRKSDTQTRRLHDTVLFAVKVQSTMRSAAFVASSSFRILDIGLMFFVLFFFIFNKFFNETFFKLNAELRFCFSYDSSRKFVIDKCHRAYRKNKIIFG